MTEFKKLKNHELHDKIKCLAVEERRLTKLILEYLVEVDRRKLYLDLAFPSLYEYLTKEIGYSEGAAQRRIDAARLMQRIPEVAEKIESGTIKLSQISKLQKACRNVKKTEGKTVNIATQRQLLKEFENAGAAQTDKILATELNFDLKTDWNLKNQRDDSVRIEMTFTKVEMQMLRKAQELLSQTTGGDLKATILKMAEKVTATVAVKPKILGGPIEKLKERQVSPSVGLTQKTKTFIIQRDQSCQYKNHQTGRLCGSRFFLEIDHIQPKFAGGSNNVQNLRVLCRNHNQYRYEEGK